MDAFVVLDTHRLIGKLQQRGFSAQQAEGIAEALRELDASSWATKSDLQELKIDLVRWMIGTQLAYAAILIGVLASLL